MGKSATVTVKGRSVEPPMTIPPPSQAIDPNGIVRDLNTFDTTKPSVTLEVTSKDGTAPAYVRILASILASLEGRNATFIIEIKADYGAIKYRSIWHH